MTSTIDFRQVQANILLPYAPNQANCARFMHFRFDPDQLSENRKWMRKLRKRVSYHTDVRDSAGRPTQPDGDVRVNVGLTWSGLEALGYDPFVLTNLHEEFREGMRERAERLLAAWQDAERTAIAERERAERLLTALKGVRASAAALRARTDELLVLWQEAEEKATEERGKSERLLAVKAPGPCPSQRRAGSRDRRPRGRRRRWPRGSRPASSPSATVPRGRRTGRAPRSSCRRGPPGRCPPPSTR